MARYLVKDPEKARMVARLVEGGLSFKTAIEAISEDIPHKTMKEATWFFKGKYLLHKNLINNPDAPALVPIDLPDITIG